eukprot:2434883-Alexandrium_andersonii.AAC.1
MSASLVGSEMCIRDSKQPKLSAASVARVAATAASQADANDDLFAAAFSSPPLKRMKSSSQHSWSDEEGSVISSTSAETDLKAQKTG